METDFVPNIRTHRISVRVKGVILKVHLDMTQFVTESSRIEQCSDSFKVFNLRFTARVGSEGLFSLQKDNAYSKRRI